MAVTAKGRVASGGDDVAVYTSHVAAENHLCPGLLMPAGAESSEGEDLQLFSLEDLESLTPEKAMSPVPLGSDEAP